MSGTWNKLKHKFKRERRRNSVSSTSTIPSLSNSSSSSRKKKRRSSIFGCLSSVPQEMETTNMQQPSRLSLPSQSTLGLATHPSQSLSPSNLPQTSPISHEYHADHDDNEESSHTTLDIGEEKSQQTQDKQPEEPEQIDEHLQQCPFIRENISPCTISVDSTSRDAANELEVMSSTPRTIKIDTCCEPMSALTNLMSPTDLYQGTHFSISLNSTMAPRQP